MIRYALLILAGSILSACSPAKETAAPAPIPTSNASNGWPHGAMVSVANPEAAAAAIAVLENGGHAVDAAIAAHAVLGLVEPESSGIGGSAFMLVYDKASDSLVVFDGRETAPSGATPEMFIKDGQPLGFRELWTLGTTVGVPGAVSVYEASHARFGRADWSSLFSHAIDLANAGFEVTAKFVRYNEPLQQAFSTGAFPAAAEYMFPGGEAVTAGDIKTNSPYAATLERIAQEGADALYNGVLAEAIVDRSQQAPAPSSMTLDDIAGYETAEREAVCGGFRVKRICSVPPPSSGIMQITIPALYDEMRVGDETEAERIQLFVDAQRLAYADRDHFVGDPAFANVPVQQLIDPKYIEHRATQRFDPAESATHGDPSVIARVNEGAWLNGEDQTNEVAGTTHLSIIDGDGNAVSMTASVGFPYGSLRMVHGFFLNNELTDFSRDVPADGEPSANVVAPGKRPRSSMSPTIIFGEDGSPAMLTGSAGGSSILAYSAKTVLGVFDWGLSAQDAADFPNIVARGDSVGIEVSRGNGQQIADDLTAAGYSVTPGRGENSGLHVIVVRPDGMDGAADSRRHGVVKSLPGGKP